MYTTPGLLVYSVLGPECSALLVYSALGLQCSGFLHTCHGFVTVAPKLDWSQSFCFQSASFLISLTSWCWLLAGIPSSSYMDLLTGSPSDQDGWLSSMGVAQRTGDGTASLGLCKGRHLLSPLQGTELRKHGSCSIFSTLEGRD